MILFSFIIIIIVINIIIFIKRAEGGGPQGK